MLAVTNGAGRMGCQKPQVALQRALVRFMGCELAAGYWGSSAATVASGPQRATYAHPEVPARRRPRRGRAGRPLYLANAGRPPSPGTGPSRRCDGGGGVWEPRGSQGSQARHSRSPAAFRPTRRRGILPGMSTRLRSQAGPPMTLGNIRANPSVAPAGPVVLRQSNTWSAKRVAGSLVSLIPSVPRTPGPRQRPQAPVAAPTGSARGPEAYPCGAHHGMVGSAPASWAGWSDRTPRSGPPIGNAGRPGDIDITFFGGGAGIVVMLNRELPARLAFGQRIRFSGHNSVSRRILKSGRAKCAHQ
jgi:hypothetical protein